MSQLHKRFTSEQVKKLLDRYLKNEIERTYIQEILGIKRRRFFVLLKQYKENPQHFTVQYRRTKAPRTISPMIEQNILKELSPMFFLSGAIFPIRGAPSSIIFLAKINPLSYGVDGIRAALIGESYLGLSNDYLVLSAVSLILLIIGSYLFSKIEI